VYTPIPCEYQEKLSRDVQQSLAVRLCHELLDCTLECRRFGKHRNCLQRLRCPQCGKTYTEQHKRLFTPMILPGEKALLAVQLLIEGTSIRAIERITHHLR